MHIRCISGNIAPIVEKNLMKKVFLNYYIG